MSRTLFIGDIHGCADELSELYLKMQVTSVDTVYATGDVINGGPKSFEVLQFLVANNIQSVLGNHELNFFEYVKDTNKKKKKKKLFDELEKKLKGQSALWAFLENLPKYIEQNRFILLHAWLRPNIALTEQDVKDLVRIREHEWKPWHDFYTWDKPIIYWHWAQQGLRFTKNTRWLDSGCMWGGHLTGYCLETGDLWQVRARKMYGKPDNWKDDK